MAVGLSDGPELAECYDLIIIGAGASGCVLASRLSEQTEKRVLLIEAGPDALPGHEHADILDPFPLSSTNARFFWSALSAEVTAPAGPGCPRPEMPYLQARGVGGGSNVNGMAAERGQAADYDEWEDVGAAGWGWEEVLPYFRKLENDLDFSGPMHGKDGPIPIRRVPHEQWAPFAQELGNAFRRRGVALVEDSNAEDRDGLSSMPMNCLTDRRVSASMGYLTEDVRRRSNLVIRANTTASRLVLEGKRVCGVEVRTEAGSSILSAREVIVSCGAILSPTLLLRSGIGPADRLLAVGIEPLHELRGVGRNLQNHPLVALVMHLPSTAMQSIQQRPWQQNRLRYSSRLPGCAAHDMLIIPANKADWHSLGQRTGLLALMVGKAYSKGYVELSGKEPTRGPRVCFNLLDDSRDFDRLVAGLKMVFDVLNDEEVLRVRNEVFVPNAAVIARLARRNTWNAIQARLISTALRIGALRRKALRGRTLDVVAISQDTEAIRNYVRRHVQAVYHPCGTCRMGDPSDHDAVVDSSGRVFGLAGLRVVDASVFPTVPSAGTHLPVLMAAEKMASHIKTEWLGRSAYGTTGA